jgi:hypothetical protein
MFIGFDPKYNFEMYSPRKFQREKTKKRCGVPGFYTALLGCFQFQLLLKERVRKHCGLL